MLPLRVAAAGDGLIIRCPEKEPTPQLQKVCASYGCDSPDIIMCVEVSSDLKKRKIGVLARGLLLNFSILITNKINRLGWRSTVAREDHALY
jgi:hypothetical protein